MEREKKLDMSTSWKWVGDFQLGQYVFTVWERYNENFRRRYAITTCRRYPQPEEEQPGPQWRVIAQFRAKYPYAQFCWIAGDYEAIHSY